VQESNIALAIDVLAEVSQYRQYIGLVIVGSGIGKLYLKTYALQKGVADKVMFESPRKDMTSFYKSAYALMITSMQDDYEDTIRAAAAAGCVIISSKNASAMRLIENKESGFLCDVNDPKEYVDAVNNLLNNERLRMKMRERIQESAKVSKAEEKEDRMQTLSKSWENAITVAKGY
jgi:glycosyltransferase involved in cell wall biosynthesis